MSEVSEVTLKAFFDSTWFKATARIIMIAGALGIGYVGGVLTVVNAKVTALEANIATVKNAQIFRDRDVISQRNNVNSDLNAIRMSVTATNSKVTTLGEDVAEIKGILQQMNQMKMKMDHDAAWQVPVVGEIKAN